MRAATIESYGPPEVLQVREVTEPSISKPTEVKVAVHAAAINPIDWKIRAGGQRGAIRYRLPRALGMDLSGVVTEVGGAVTRFKVGDPVWGSPSPWSPGCYAETTVVDEQALGHKPKTWSHIEAASLPLVGLTAWQCLMPRLTERQGQRVFIQAGSGGVGTIAIQLAKQLGGAHVTTTCSPRNHDLVRELGADEVIDYRTTDFADVLSDQDIILDALGGAALDKAFRVVAAGGRIASIVSGLPGNTKKYGPNLGLVMTGVGIARLRLRGLASGVQATTVVRALAPDQLDAMAALADEGKIRPVVDEVFPLEQAAEAHAYGETGRIRGKVVLQVRE